MERSASKRYSNPISLYFKIIIIWFMVQSYGPMLCWRNAPSTGIIHFQAVTNTTMLERTAWLAPEADSEGPKMPTACAGAKREVGREWNESRGGQNVEVTGVGRRVYWVQESGCSATLHPLNPRLNLASITDLSQRYC